MKTFKPFSLIGIFSIAFLVTFCFLFRTNAQEVYPKKEQTYTLSEGCPQDRLGEAAALWWDRNGMRSDNYIYYCFAGLSNDCKCGTKTNYIRFLPGVDYKQVGNSYPCSGSDLRGEYGPGRSVEVEATVKYTGKNYLIASWLDCWYNCTNVYSLGKIIFKTDNPYNPINDEATKAADNVSDTYIKITWDKGTHIPTGNHGYKIYRDGNTTPIYENDSESKFYFIDYNCNPGEEHTYEIKTWYEPTNKISSGVTAEGSTFKLNVNTISRDFDVLIQWTAANGIKDKDGNTAQAYSIKRYDPVTGIYEYIDDSPVVDMTQDNVSDTEGIPGFNYTYIVTPIISGGGGGFKPDSTLGMKKPDGIINGTIMAPFGGYVADVEVCAIRIDSVAQGDSGEAYCAITDLDGTYTIPEIYYYKGANFRIIPTKGNHGFKPAFRDVEFLPHSHDMQADFTDTSSFSITGRIIQTFAGDTCNVKGVEMHVNDLYRGNKSDGDGNFSLTVDEIGDYTIKPVFYEHGFAPADSSMYIEENQSGLLFEDTTRYTLEGYVRAPCEIYIGTADLWIFSRNYPSGCFDTIINTEEGTGYFSIELPAREYYFDLITFYPEDPLTLTAEMVEDYFNLQTIDLTEGDLKKNLIYRKPPKIQVSGFTEYGCEPYDVPIVRQGTSYTILIEVIEEFGEESCLTDTGYVVVYNSLVDGGIKLDTLQLSGGQALYGFRPGMPDIIPPHTKLLEIVAFIDDEMDQWSQEILVTGNHPREATFVTVSPEIPFMILRDPPGDASYSYLEEGTTSETAMRINRELGGSVNIYGEVKLGCAFSAGEGISFDYAFWGLIKGSLEVGGSVSDQSEYIMNITNVEQFSTSGNPNVTGEEGDVFAGASLNMLYALTDIIKYDPENCSVTKTVDLIMAPQGFNTTFMYTEGHIRDVLIPQLQQIRDMYLEAGSDSARFYARQVDTWEQILKMNKKQKEQSKFIENKSISSGVSYESFTETTSTESYTFDFSLFLETAVAVEIGSEVMGSGVMLGAEVKFRMAYGQSETTTFTETRKTGFVLEDDDEGDYFSVDILVDPVYATPVFKLKSGATSCPWEPGTQPREGVQLTTNTYYQYVDEPQGQAIFQLNLGNTSQSDEEREYNLVFLQESNPDGAVITLGGSPVQGGVPTPYTIGPAESVDATVTVKIGPLAYDYNNLIFSLMSGCEVPDPSIVDYVELDVNFASPCSEVVMAKPYDNWYINDAMNSILQVVIEDYDTTIFNMAKLQYSPAGLNTWSNALIVEPKDMADVPTIRYLSLHKLDDGLYDIRVALECTDALSYSKVSTGIIDRRPPEAFGLPEPRDGVLDPGDMISVEFNEDIDCHSVHFENITVTNLGTGVNLNVQTGCKDDMVLIMPDTTGVVFDNDTFQINLTGIEDIYGNAMSDTLIWRFVLPSSENITLPDVDDYDEDGILNDADNCPISANADQEDLDEDGIGDVCDPDMDNDAIMNIGDNCPFSSNNNQHDLDEDGIGDTCDVDIDGDEVENQYDNCVYVYNPDQSDVDDDQIGDACSTVGIKEAASVESIQLFGNYPNPFKDQTTFRYNIPFACEVEISVVNMTGMVVEILKSKNDIPGKNEILWNTKDFASGVYYYRFKVLDTGGNIKFQENRMMILSR